MKWTKNPSSDALVIANEELDFQNEEKEKRAAELVIANKELAFQSQEKENRAAELILANKELAFQSQEKENRAAELIIANKELQFQKTEKGKRASELIIANKELDFQNDEKENRAAELIIANKELLFQNQEKENRAAELIIANKELAFQNDEKENRAAELIIANKELLFQNQEKENRAAELIIANEELAFQNDEKEKRAEELISYKHFFYNSMDLACFATVDGYFEEVNDAFTKSLGYTKKELTERKFFDFVHPDDVGSTIKEMEKLSLGIKTFNFINRFKTKQGIYKYLEWNSVFNPETKKVYAAARDITEKVIANTELDFQNQEKENRAAELVIANKELAFQNDEKENRAAELAIANEELAFQNHEKEKRAQELAIANEELAFQNNEKENRAAELVIANEELAFQNHEKENRAAELAIANKELAFQNNEKENRAAELFIANKELAFQNDEKEKRANELLIANTQLTKAQLEIHKLNEDLEQKVIARTAELESANKELGSFSYSVSHDLRAPIRAINGYARILEEDYIEKLDDEGIEVVHAIIKNSKRMGQLIDDLLAFSKLGRKQISFSDINMRALVYNVKEELLVEDAKSKIVFNVDMLAPAKGDQSLIKQVWVNLISNAVKYSKHKPETRIEIGNYEEGSQVVYFIKDNGAGFNMQYYDKLFGVFQRLHSHEEFEGTGIGLAIVQRIVFRHGGTVWAESKLNEETCFYFSLPNINS